MRLGFGHPAIRRLLLPGMALLLASAAAWAQTPPAADPVVAQRGAITLTASQVRQMLDNADPPTRQQLQHNPAALANLVRDRVLQMSVLAEAHAHHWDSRPEVIWRAEQAHDNAIAQSYLASLTQPDAAFPSEAEIAAAYQANKGRLVMPRQYHLAQIYLGVPPGAPAATDVAAQKRLLDWRAQIRANHADFATLARRQSDDHATGPNGGDLGWTREDQVLPAVRSAVAGLAEGSLSDPIRVNDGWHLVKLIGTRPAAPATLAEVRDALVRALRQQRVQQSGQAYLDNLLHQQPIQMNEIQLSTLAKP